MKTRMSVTVFAIGCMVLLTAGPAGATLFTWNDYTIVEADAFVSGGSAGNTTQITNPGTYFAVDEEAAVGTQYKWAHRGAWGHTFNTLGGAAIDANDLFQGRNTVVDGSTGQTVNIYSKDLRTTITGLASGAYDVFLVQAVRNTGAANADMNKVVADLDVGQAGPTTERKSTDAGIIWTGYTGSGTNNYAEIVLNPLGQVTGTEFSVLVGVPDVVGDRSMYVGVAYQAVPTPEPSALALLAVGLSGLLAYAWRKRK